MKYFIGSILLFSLVLNVVLFNRLTLSFEAGIRLGEHQGFHEGVQYANQRHLETLELSHQLAMDRLIAREDHRLMSARAYAAEMREWGEEVRRAQEDESN